MNYLVATGSEDHLYGSNSTQYLGCYGLAPYPVRRHIDRGVAELESIAIKLRKQVEIGLESWAT